MSLRSENAVLLAELAALKVINAELRADLDHQRTFTRRLLYRLRAESERHWAGEHRGGDAIRSSGSELRDTTGFVPGGGVL